MPKTECDPPHVRLQEEELRSASQPLDGSLLQTVFVVPDMHCGVCISSIEKKLNALPHVEQARANLSTRRVAVTWDASAGKGVALTGALGDLGFNHSIFSGDEDYASASSAKGKQLLLSLAVAGFAMANIMLLSVSVWSGAEAETAKLFHLISGLIAVPAVAFAGRPFFQSAIQALSARRLNMDVPISLAVLLALGMGLFESLSGGTEAYFDACVMLLFFLLIGRYLDHLMREKARGSVESLAKLTSKGGVVVHENGATDYIAQSEIRTGMTLRVLPGERFPVDARIINGTTDVDRSLVTGESATVLGKTSDTFEAGVLNLTGPVDVITTSDATNSFLAEVMKMMESAQNGRGQYVRIAERMASIYAPAVHLLALVTFVGWMVISSGDWKTSIYAAIAVLIITCPCALGLAVPVVHVIGANRLLKEGIFMRDGSGFERLSEIDTAVFDKTGTLTLGTPQVVDTWNLDTERRSFIHSLAARSSHPASKAVAAHLSSEVAVVVEHVSEMPGYGIEAVYAGRRIRLGRPSWVAELFASNPNLRAEGSVAFAAEGESSIGFLLEDIVRPEVSSTIHSLQDSGLEVEILSGDQQAIVESLAGELGIGTFHAEVTPIQKVERLTELKEQGHNVLMVGDGLNDAPALASAHVSMAPASASEVGRLAADFVFTRNDLTAISFAHKVALRTTSLIKQNFALAIAYNCLAVPLAVAGYVTPLIAALAMSASSIVVVANSMRLNWSSGERDTEGSEYFIEKLSSENIALDERSRCELGTALT